MNIANRNSVTLTPNRLIGMAGLALIGMTGTYLLLVEVVKRRQSNLYFNQGVDDMLAVRDGKIIDNGLSRFWEGHDFAVVLSHGYPASMTGRCFQRCSRSGATPSKAVLPAPDKA